MPDKLQIDLPILLPDIRDARDACVSRLISSLEAKSGIDHAHVVEGTELEPDRLCVHYDSDVLSLARIRRVAENLGAELTDHFGHILWNVDGVGHARRARILTERLRKIPGVMEAEAVPEGLLRVEFDRDRVGENTIRETVAKMGIRIVSDVQVTMPVEQPTDEHEHEHGPGERNELIVAGLSGVLLVSGWLIEQFTELPDWLPLVLYLGTYALGGFFTLREAIDSIRVGRFEIDFLMLVAAAG
ncbi:MAG: heavy metal translocating P-type ATPase, partial [Rhodothermia bacterium]